MVKIMVQRGFHYSFYQGKTTQGILITGSGGSRKKVLKNNFEPFYKAADALARDRNMFFAYYDDRIVMDTGNPEVEKAFSIFFNFNTGFGGHGRNIWQKGQIPVWYIPQKCIQSSKG